MKSDKDLAREILKRALTSLGPQLMGMSIMDLFLDNAPDWTMSRAAKVLADLKSNGELVVSYKLVDRRH